MMADVLIALVGLLTVHAGSDPSMTGLGVSSLPAVSSPAVFAHMPLKKNPNTFGVEVTARAGAVMDVNTGEMLFSKDANTAYPIASLTKLMTVMTFLDHHPDLEKKITILHEDEPSEGENPFPQDEQFTQLEILRSVLIGSVNAGANVLGRSAGDQAQFVREMNEKARALGMRHAFFVEPTGLDPHNRASAKDVALALRAALAYPEIRESTERNAYDVVGRATGKPYHIKSTNLLLDSFLNKDAYHIVAGKTGSLPEAGFCLAQVTEDTSGHQIIAVVLGSENHFSRFQDAKALTAWAFENFKWK